jgi:protein-tyrosine phosphatase
LKNYFEEQGTKYIHLQLYDDMAEELIPEVLKAAHFIDDAIKSGGTVFVHCAMGKSRSVSAIIMYLMHHQRMSYEESLQLIRASRPIAKPNLSYERQLKEYYEGLLKSK